MEETHIQQLLDLERQKLAIQIAATEVWIDDKVKASEGRIIAAVTGAITNAVVELKSDIMDVRSELRGTRAELKAEIQDVRTELKVEIHGVRTELKTEIQDVRTELKAEIVRLEHKIDNHLN
ncbi:hypothetical protein ACGFNP_60480 [Nonomuraea sp. NPDC049269]|uniref:hypothetical protein n=1 Tax=Nonomuraea sp. NPDC049269 TaxID=3364349 RepID=UPI00371C4EF0